MVDFPPPAYPLQWPATRPRKTVRRTSKFSSNGSRLTVAVGLARLKDELGRLGARASVVSSNIELRRDGLPLSGRPEGRCRLFSARGAATLHAPRYLQPRS